MLGERNSALKGYDKIIKINPEDPDVWNAKGNILSELERTEEALDCYDKALELCLDITPDSAMWNRKGNALMELGRYDEALKCYNEALKHDSGNDAFICNKGVALLELNRYEKAIECFRRALVINPSNEDAKILKDECLENL